MDKSTKILVVDDDPVLRALTSDCLAALGYQTNAVSGGLEALAFLGKGELPSLILLDMFMPDLDGIQVLKQIRGQQQWQNLKVLLLSAENDAERVLDQHALQADAYLRKPYQLRDLAQSVEALLCK